MGEIAIRDFNEYTITTLRILISNDLYLILHCLLFPVFVEEHSSQGFKTWKYRIE